MALPVESEEVVTRTIASHIQTYYPGALFHVDYGSGLQMTRGQAIKQAMLNGRRGHPDIVIYEPRCGYVGLALEVKRDGTRLRKRDGSPADGHLAEQMQYLGDLASRGWYSVIGTGTTDCLKLVDDYLTGKLRPEDDQE